jgi:glycerol-3-phosphate dehydrogenase
MTDSQRLLIETLRWACAHGARCLSYVEVTELKTAHGAVTGVGATDRESGEALAFSAPKVINSAGPWSRELAGAFDRDVAELFSPSLAFNLLFDREPPSDVALALSAPAPGSHTWFLYPMRGRLFAGTAHAPWSGVDRNPQPNPEQIDAAIADINAAAPSLELQRNQVLRVYAGLLPSAGKGSSEISLKPIIHDHGKAGGPSGLISTSGVKYTTSRAVAETTLRRAFADLPEIRNAAKRPEAAETPDFRAIGADETTADKKLRRTLQEFADAEAAIHIDDLLLRRGTWGENPKHARALAPRICKLLGWDKARTTTELNRLD